MFVYKADLSQHGPRPPLPTFSLAMVLQVLPPDNRAFGFQMWPNLCIELLFNNARAKDIAQDSLKTNKQKKEFCQSEWKSTVHEVVLSCLYMPLYIHNLWCFPFQYIRTAPRAFPHRATKKRAPHQRRHQLSARSGVSVKALCGSERICTEDGGEMLRLSILWPGGLSAPVLLSHTDNNWILRFAEACTAN